MHTTSTAQDTTLSFKQVVAQEKESLGNPDRVVGLALSGGGIRSATFALGVMQRFKEIGLLKQIDYLSTVSGGGYAGGWLSGNLQRHKNWLEPGPDSDSDSDWDESIRHLRRYSNYLAPKTGLLSADTWSVGMIWLRNTVLIQLTIVFLLACILILPWPAFSVFKQFPDSGGFRWLTIALFVFGASGVARNQLRISRKNGGLSKPTERRRWVQALFGLVAVALIILYLHVFEYDPFDQNRIDVLHAVITGILCMTGGFLLEPFETSLIQRLVGRKAVHITNYGQGSVQWFIVVPMLLASFLVASVMWHQINTIYGPAGPFCHLDLYSEFFFLTLQRWPFPLSVAFVSLSLFSFASLRKGSGGWGVIWAFVAAAFSITTFHALLAGIMLILRGWADSGLTGELRAFVFAPAMVMYAFALAIVVIIGIIGRNGLEGSREWWSRLGAWLAIYGLGWFLVSAVSVYAPSAIAYLLTTNWPALLAGSGWVGTTLTGLLAGKSEQTGGPGAVRSIPAKAKEAVAVVAPYVFILGLFGMVAFGLNQLIQANSGNCLDGGLEWTSLSCGSWQAILGVFIASAALLAVLSRRIDINEFSLNAFYRSRLVRCYLGATRPPQERNPERFTNFDDKDDLDLAELPVRPLHLVNCALNLGGSSDLSLHTRHSANYTLSRLHCGTHYRITGESDEEDAGSTGRVTRKDEEIGYSPTRDYGKPTIGQAMSISGAAASPNMGYHTSSVVAFLMTVFNVRLGWWLPRPTSDTTKSASPNWALPYLTKELFGGADESSVFLSLSDGGHFENLAAYELIRRACDVVIISDAECDPNLQFEGLGSLIRMCSVDLKTRIEIDLSGFTRDPSSGWSRSRCAVGTITYPGGKKGTLIYLKASMTGHEPSEILQYRAGRPAFPHESTGDQFYSEQQFESYRQLGYETARRTFDSVLDENSMIACPFTAAKQLTQRWAPPVKQLAGFTRNTERLMDLWQRISEDSRLRDFDSELNPGWLAGQPRDFPAKFYACSEMLQLMENVYLDLNLEETWDDLDNRGWQELFTGWAATSTIRRVWAMTQNSYGLRFRGFCTRRLKLPDCT